MADLLEQVVVDAPVDANAIVERQTRVERKPLEVHVGVDVDGAVLAVGQQLLDADVGLEVDDGHVRLHGRSVQRGGGGLATALARLVPRRGADGEALRAGYDGVEGVEGRARDESGLVGDPEVLDRVERIREDDALDWTLAANGTVDAN